MIGFDPISNTQAEAAVLAIAINNPAWAKKVAALPNSLFGNELHSMIHRAIVAMKGEGVDLVTVDDALCRAGFNRTEEVVDVSTKWVSTYLGEEYIKILQDNATRRAIVREASKLIEDVHDWSVDISTARDRALLALKDITAPTNTVSTPASEAVLKFSMYVDEMAKGDHTKRLYTGLPGFDGWIGGFQGPKLVVIGARPSVGKSAFALQIAALAAGRGKRVLLCSYEMGEEEIVARLVSRKCDIPVQRFDNGDFTLEEYKAIGDAYSTIHPMPLHILTTGNRVTDVRREAMRLKEAYGLDAIFVDYLQLMDVGGKSDNRATQVGEISRGLKQLSMELDIPVFALTQLNRDSTKENRRPTMADARESGSIEQDANIFILLHRPMRHDVPDDKLAEYNRTETRGTQFLEVIVDKNRQGRLGIAYTVFDGANMTFTEVK